MVDAALRTGVCWVENMEWMVCLGHGWKTWWGQMWVGGWLGTDWVMRWGGTRVGVVALGQGCMLWTVLGGWVVKAL